MKIHQDKLRIINYHDQYKEDLKRLTLEWLEKGFLVEPEDWKFIDNPTHYVLNDGGFIFLAQYGNEIVGTVSLIKIDNQNYELAKLAVAENYQGLKFGKQLVQLAIDKCKGLAAKKVILYSARKLEAAYNLYEGFGFVEVQQNKLKYIEADIMMELDLTKY